MVIPPFPRKFAVISIGLGLLAVAGCEKAENPAPEAGAPAAPAAPAASAAPKPATPNSFDDVTAQLDPGGNLYFYLSTAQWLGKLSEGVDTLHDLLLSASNNISFPDPAEADQAFATLKDMVQKSGLEDITGIGASSFEVSPAFYRNKLFVHHYPDKGTGLLWSLYGKAPHALAGLDLLPADTATAGFGDFDLALLINFLRQEAAQSGIPEVTQALDQYQTEFAGVTQLKLDDVLASLNGSMGMVITLDATSTISVPIGNQQQTVPAPRIALLIAVKNDLIFKQVDKSIGAQPGIIKVDEPDLQMRTMQAPPMVPGLNLRPTVAQWNGYLVIASDDQLIRDMIAVQKGGPGFKSTPEFATLSAGLSDQGNSFVVATRRFVDTMKQFQSQAYANQPGLNQAQAAVLQRVMAQYQKTGPIYAVGSQLPNGWLTISQGSR